MKYKCIVTYEYPVDHKPPVLAEIYLHGDKVKTSDIEPAHIDKIKELEKIKSEMEALDLWGAVFERYNKALGDCIDIIDEHITELKGEQE